MEILVSIGGGLVGTLVGAAVAWFAGRAQYRLEATFTMHREFHSPEMTLSRNLAGKTVRDHGSENFDWIRRELSPQDAQHVWNVMYFYQRLWLAIRFKNVYNRYVPEMFGETFCWWYFKSYEDQLVRPLDWQAGRHVSCLMEWIERNAKQSEIEEWKMRATGMRDPRPEESLGACNRDSMAP